MVSGTLRQNEEFFPSGEKENTGIAELFRGFLTMHGRKRIVLPRDVNKPVVP
jgi:hypothetical protein